jgi:uncharacterized protein (TIGR02001 family)
VALIIATGPAIAEEASPISFNVGVVSNYMWRGITQSANHAAVQGGIDFEHESGFFMGTWASTVDFRELVDSDGNILDRPSYEWDIYAGFGKEVGDFSYKASLTYFAYPDQNADNWNSSSLDVSGTWKMLTAGLAYTLTGEAPKGSPFREGDLYYYGKVSFDLPMEITLSGTVGYADFTDLNSTGDYTHWQLAMSKDFGRFGEFSANYDQNDGGTGEYPAYDSYPKFSVGWKKSF